MSYNLNIERNYAYYLFSGGDFAQSKLFKLNLIAGIIDIDADQTPLGIIIQHHTLGNLTAHGARLLG